MYRFRVWGEENKVKMLVEPIVEDLELRSLTITFGDPPTVSELRCQMVYWYKETIVK